MNLIPFLIKQKIISKQEGEKILEETARSLKSPEEVLIEKKIMPENSLFSLKSKLINVPLKKVDAEKISPELLNLIPHDSIEFYKVVPLGVDKEKNILEVGMVYPENYQAKEALRFLARQQKLSLQTVLISLSDFRKLFQKVQTPEKEVESALAKLEEEFGAPSIDQNILEEIKENKTPSLTEEQAPIIRMVAVILRQAVEGKASDIHIEPTSEELRVRFRLDGILYPSLTLPLRVHPAIVARIKILSHLKTDETRIPQDGRFTSKINNKRIDFRVATFPTILGEKVAIRVLDTGESTRTLQDLGITGRNYEAVMRAIKKPYGMILSTGPTGSGKTSTLYTILNLLNQNKVNIVTLEDPVEYFINGINQSQVRPEIGYTFAKGLRQILRQDPNVIMVGEIRDEETADLAVNAALTGHLVLSTLHTNNAIGVVPRLLDMGIKPFLLSSLNIAIAQRLVRVLCPHCKTKAELSTEDKNYLLEMIKTLPKETKTTLELKNNLEVFNPKGCPQCNSTGYSGRTGIFEILEMTDQLNEIITQNLSEKNLKEEAKRQGMLTMEQDGIIKVLKGITSLAELKGVTSAKETKE